MVREERGNRFLDAKIVGERSVLFAGISRKYGRKLVKLLAL